MKKVAVFFIVAVMAIGLVVGCGGGADDSSSGLENKFEGRFLTIGYTPEFQVKEHEAGVILESKSGIEIQAIAIPMPESKMGNLKSLESVTGDIKSEISNYSEQKVKLGKHNAIWIEGENDGFHGVAAVVPFDGWMLMAITDEPGESEEEVELTRQIIKSVRITDTDMPDPKDFKPKELEPIEDEDIEEYPPDDDEDADETSSDDDEDFEHSVTYTDEEGNEVDVNVSIPTDIEVGRNAMKLSETYKGEYFTIKHPSSAEINNFSFDMITTTTIEIEDLIIMITATNDPDITGISSVEGETLVISGHDAVASRVSFNDSFSHTYFIQMDGWDLSINGTTDKSSEKYVDTLNAMIESFVITNENYFD